MLDGASSSLSSFEFFDGDLLLFGDDVADLIHRHTSAFFPSITCNSERKRESCLLISFLTRSQICFNRSLLI